MLELLGRFELPTSSLPRMRQQQMATKKGLEPSTSGVTGRRSNQLSYLAIAPRPLFTTEAYHTIKLSLLSSSFLRESKIFSALRVPPAGRTR